MSAIAITKENFETEVLKSEQPVLIDFWASWCMPCKMLSPVVEEIAGEAKDAKICKINVDEQPELSAAFRIISIPTLVVMKDGKVTGTSVGVKSKKDIMSMLSA